MVIELTGALAPFSYLVLAYLTGVLMTKKKKVL